MGCQFLPADCMDEDDDNEEEDDNDDDDAMDMDMVASPKLRKRGSGSTGMNE